MKLEAGKTYKTRDGRIYGPLFRTPSGGFGCAKVPPEHSKLDQFMWYEDGRFRRTSEMPVDLIEEHNAVNIVLESRKVLADGKYGDFYVHQAPNGLVSIGVDVSPSVTSYIHLSVEQMRYAVHLLTAIADFVESEDQAK